MTKVNNKVNEQEIFPKPKICCIDISEEITETLTKSSFNLFSGTLGSIRDVPNKERGFEHYLQFDHKIPPNLHEYDILIIDLTNKVQKEFVPIKIEDIKTSESEVILPVCRYPATIFDPRPGAALYLGKEISSVKKRPFIIIVFASKQYDVDYNMVSITDNYAKEHSYNKLSLYDFDRNIPLSNARTGEEVTVCEDVKYDLYNLLSKHRSDLSYRQSFRHPTSYDNELKNYIPEPNFIPLMKNVNEEIVSYIDDRYDDKKAFIFPDIFRKSEFLLELLQNVLPGMFPELFPFSTQFKWLENPEYFVSNHENLLRKKRNLLEEYNKKLSEVDDEIAKNKDQYVFLHMILKETDDELVKAVKLFLDWLEFEKVTIKDEESAKPLEEDLEVELDNGILVIEVKGIGRTSTDNDCSQISKIRNRRQKERNKFDVYALYIVNHQRYLPPLERKNPPFTVEQIKDAEHDDRGLLTTWQLFRLYFDIENGLIFKEEARKQMLETGLVTFKPKLGEKLGLPEKLYEKGSIAIIEIENTPMKVGDTIILEKDGIYEKGRILSIKLDNQPLEKVTSGIIGIRLDKTITNRTTLWTLNSM